MWILRSYGSSMPTEESSIIIVQAIVSFSFKKRVTEARDGSSSVFYSKPSTLTFINIPIHDVRVRCLIDTGASHSFIHSSFLHQLRHSPISPMHDTFTLADGQTPFIIHGKVQIHIRINNITTTISALISKSHSTSCILGQDWIRKYSVDIHHSTNQLVIHTKHSSIIIPLDVDLDHSTFDLKLATAIIIPPHHEMIMKVLSPISSATNALFCPNRSLQHKKSIIIPNALLSIKNYA